MATNPAQRQWDLNTERLSAIIRPVPQRLNSTDIEWRGLDLNPDFQRGHVWTESQQQLIAAVYLGRDHLHCSEMNMDLDLTRAAIDHIPAEEYAQILSEKSSSLETYLGQLIACAQVSNFDLDTM